MLSCRFSEIHYAPRAALLYHRVAFRSAVRVHARRSRLVRSAASCHRQLQSRLRSIQSVWNFFLIYLAPLLSALADPVATLFWTPFIRSFITNGVKSDSILPSPFCPPRAPIGLHGASVSAAQIISDTGQSHAHTRARTHILTRTGERRRAHAHAMRFLKHSFLTSHSVCLSHSVTSSQRVSFMLRFVPLTGLINQILKSQGILCIRSDLTFGLVKWGEDDYRLNYYHNKNEEIKSF